MAHAIRVPRLGWSMEEGILVRWLKQPGDEVAVDEPLFELEGEKALQEIGSLDAGILHLPADAPAPGSVVLVGAVLGYLLAPGETGPATCGSPESTNGAAANPQKQVSPPKQTEPPQASAAPAQAETQPNKPLPAGAPPAGPAVRRLARELGVDLNQVDGTGKAGRITHHDVGRRAAIVRKSNGASHSTAKAGGGKADGAQAIAAEPVASPRARRVAAELGIDWTTLAGSGRDGRVRESDVRGAKAAQTAAVDGRPRGEEPIKPGENLLTPRRKAIAERLRRSRDCTVPVTLTTTADVTNLVALREQFKSAAASVVPAYTDLVGCLVARVVRRHPRLAVRWSDDQSALHAVGEEGIHVGIAVDTPGGLLVPVVRDILRKSLVAVAEESRTLAERARAGRLTSGEMQAAVITVSNLGAYGIDAFTPVINFPEVAILGLGAVRREPVVDADDRVVIRERMVLSLSFDHAAVDGAPAAAFLADIASALANPAALLLGD